tara:strand:+ start:1123 stop:1407 length:285 start_codon:yes stop_codon:yes gene_type:complete
MKKLLIALFAIVSLAGIAQAGCGKKETFEGTLSTYDAETKMIVVESNDDAKKLKLSAATVIKAVNGDEVHPNDLVGEDVTITFEHKNVDSIQGS